MIIAEVLDRLIKCVGRKNPDRLGTVDLGQVPAVAVITWMRLQMLDTWFDDESLLKSRTYRFGMEQAMLGAPPSWSSRIRPGRRYSAGCCGSRGSC